MTTIRSDRFVSALQKNGSDVPIDVQNLDSATTEKLKKAGITQKDLLEVAGSDKKISGDKEYKALFAKVEKLEKDKDHTGFETENDKKVQTASGAAYEALKVEVDRQVNIARAQGVLQSSPAVPGNDPHAKHIAEVRSQLQKEKLPTSAKGVTVFVIGEGDTAHSQAITRTIAGKKVGLAQGADVHVPDDGGHREKYAKDHPYTKELEKKGGTVTREDLAKMGVVRMEAALHAAREEIGAVRNKIPADGKTRIGNISWAGGSNLGIATEVIKNVGANDPIQKRAELEWAMKNKVKFDKTDPSHVIGARTHLAEQIAAEMTRLQNEPANKATTKKLQEDLQKEINDSRKKGLLIFNAAGNDGEVANLLGNPSGSTIGFDPIKGMVTVGAVDRSNPRSPKMWDGSASGNSIEIAAPGVNLPVDVQNKKASQITGTSFAAPYAASVAALMVAANPKITPDQIEAILTSGRVTTDLPGNTDGKGMLDPVKAVKEAKNLAQQTK
jgi:Subtilase family